MSKYEMDKIYLTRCKKTSKIHSIEKGQYYRCMRKLFEIWDGNKKSLWHTEQPTEFFGSASGFLYSWDWEDWYEYFEKPIKVSDYLAELVKNMLESAWETNQKPLYKFSSELEPNHNGSI